MTLLDALKRRWLIWVKAARREGYRGPTYRSDGTWLVGGDHDDARQLRDETHRALYGVFFGVTVPRPWPRDPYQTLRAYMFANAPYAPKTIADPAWLCVTDLGLCNSAAPGIAVRHVYAMTSWSSAEDRAVLDNVVAAAMATGVTVVHGKP